MEKKFLVTDPAPGIFTESLKNLGFEVLYQPGINYEDTLEIIPEITGLVIRGKFHADKRLIDKASELKYILRPGSGLDIIDKTTASERRIKLINSPEGNRDAVGEHALGMLLALLNNIPKANEELKKLKWIRKENTGIELKGKTIGIIGFGNTGGAFAKKLQGFEVKILAYDKYKNGFSNEYVREALETEIFNEADIVSFHVPLNTETEFMVDSSYLRNFKKAIFLLNTSRGKILRTQDLLHSIIKGQVRGACLDVFENEKFDVLTEVEKNTISELIKTRKIIMTPHVAGWTEESSDKIYTVLIDKLKEYMNEG